MKFLKRIRHRLGVLLAVIAVFVAVVLFISARSHFAIKAEATHILDAELLSVGEAVTRSFDTHISKVVNVIDNEGLSRVSGCSPRFHAIARFLVGSLDHVQDIGFITSDGTMECSVLRPTQPVQGFLMPWSLDNPPMTLAVLEDLKLDRRPLALVLNRGLNQRYVVRFAPSILPSNIGSKVIAPYLSYDALLTTGERWIHWDSPVLVQQHISPIVQWLLADPDAPIRYEKSIGSNSFPITVLVWADGKALLAVYDMLDDGAYGVGILSALTILCLLIVIAWRTQNGELDYNAVFEQGEFVAYYQPVVDMGSGGIIGCEVLLRFRTIDGKIVSPSSFITYAETTGVIMDVTHKLMIRVARELDGLSKDFGDLKVGINLTGKHFEDISVVDDIRSIFENTNTSFEQLVFELTERHPVEDFEMARMVISGIQQLGSSVALDDAGTGHGGFSYLQKLGLDVIKIDKMFVDTFNSDVTTMTIIDIIVELAKSLDMGIIAEGVESEDQVLRLRELGISAAQGFFFSPALPPAKYIDLVRRSEACETMDEKLALFNETRVAPQPDVVLAEPDEDPSEELETEMFPEAPVSSDSKEDAPALAKAS